jgi:hypothetical protein
MKLLNLVALNENSVQVEDERVVSIKGESDMAIICNAH